MTYRVVLTANAKANLREYYQRAAKDAPNTVDHWFNRFFDVIESLSEQPDRCQLAPENDAVEEEIRQLIFGKRVGTFRVLFNISGEQVQVLHIRRAAMGVANPDELRG